MPFFTFWFLLGLTLPAAAQTWYHGKALVYQGYVENNPSLWQQGIEELKQAYARAGDEGVRELYELTLAQYGWIGYCLSGNITCDDLDQFIDAADTQSDDLLDLKPYWAPAHALRGSVLAMKINQSPAKAIYLGPKSSGHLDKAVELDADDPVGWVEMGNMRYHAPSIVGGDKKEAVKCYSKAVSLFDASPGRKRNNWLYIHALVWLGQAYEATSQYPEALATYERVAREAPAFRWVQDQLIPAVKTKN
jgi:tetratricopeptide (TPR) repeat protein